MCTSINYNNGGHYFGRNLDLQVDLPVQAVITPKNYNFNFRYVSDLKQHNPLIGMAMIVDDYPLYFEAINDDGLGMAGLNFPKLAKYFPKEEGKTNVASYEIIPYILGKCSTVEEAREELKNINITDDSYSEKFHYSPLHWHIGDKNGSIVVESTEAGLKVYDNPFEVLTNCPTFDYMATNVSYYLNCTGHYPVIRFAPDTKPLDIFSTAMGSIGIPGGLDSVSRFVKVAFSVMNSFCDEDEYKNISELFHLFGTVQQTSGVNEATPDMYEITQYTAFGDTEKGLFYFTSYYNPNICCIDMKKEDLEGDKIIPYDLPKVLEPIKLN